MIKVPLSDIENSLRKFNPVERAEAIKTLAYQIKDGSIQVETEKEAFNLHCHTFFSYNAEGYSPSGLAWLAKQRGLRALGIIDFDTLDGVSEFLNASELLAVRGSAGIETRIFVPEFANDEFNSPGEPGVCYHIGIGFTSSVPAPEVNGTLTNLRQRAEQRNRDMMKRVNAHLSTLDVDYDRDVLPLTPAGNATERHMLAAYIRAAEEQQTDIATFWATALGVSNQQIQAVINNPAKLQNLIRAKLMKRGGVGYVQPGPNTFPSLHEVNHLISACGAIPCYGWLDGTSSGEQKMEELLLFLISTGIGTINIIPDRNWNISDPEQRRIKVAKLHEVVQLAQKLDLPVNVGTEMNSPGLKWVDDFDVPEMRSLYPIFSDGAHFIYGHTMMQRTLGMGYQSTWAQQYLPTRRERNTFYTHMGQLIPPGMAGMDLLKQFTPNHTPAEITGKL